MPTNPEINGVRFDNSAIPVNSRWRRCPQYNSRMKYTGEEAIHRFLGLRTCCINTYRAQRGLEQ